MKRTVEIFSAGCPTCDEAVKLVKETACSSCEVRVLDMHDEAVSERARELGITAVPAVVVNGQLADCCQAGGPTEDGLRAAGIGVAIES